MLILSFFDENRISLQKSNSLIQLFKSKRSNQSPTPCRHTPPPTEKDFAYVSFLINSLLLSFNTPLLLNNLTSPLFSTQTQPRQTPSATACCPQLHKCLGTRPFLLWAALMHYRAGAKRIKYHTQKRSNKNVD